MALDRAKSNKDFMEDGGMFSFTKKQLQEFDLSKIKFFIEFWNKFYDDKKYNLDEYYQNLNIENGLSQLSDKNIINLLKWKDKKHFSDEKISKVISKIQDINDFRFGTISEDDFSKISFFKSGNGVWNVFIKHIAQPFNFPLYDQHVFRSYCYHKNVSQDKIKLEYNNYKKYFFDIYQKLYGNIKATDIQTLKNMKIIDNSLMAYGEFLKKYGVFTE